VLADALNHREQRYRTNLENDVGQKPRSMSIRPQDIATARARAARQSRQSRRSRGIRRRHRMLFRKPSDLLPMKAEQTPCDKAEERRRNAIANTLDDRRTTVRAGGMHGSER
jgi:hypothetical protein